jgi:hypothetical protein
MAITGPGNDKKPSAADRKLASMSASGSESVLSQNKGKDFPQKEAYFICPFEE